MWVEPQREHVRLDEAGPAALLRCRDTLEVDGRRGLTRTREDDKKGRVGSGCADGVEADRVEAIMTRIVSDSDLAS